MKIALVGQGKTGQFVKKLHRETTGFDSKNPPTLEGLQAHDVIVSFLPGPPFVEYIPLFMDTNLPLVTASTGVEWGRDLSKNLQERKLKWIWASNFALGMSLIQQMLAILRKAPLLFEHYGLHIREVHHTQKKDTPSGTALRWKEWAGQPPRGETGISSERKGDEVGFHKLSLTTDNEEIVLSHRSLDRSIFARGAIWAAHKILTDIHLTPGLHAFSEIIERELLTRNNDEPQ